ncbi:MAG: hypothetical protein HRU16_09710 [Planctomycetes bacterium]|nr:hypothetical protein [Planctomycetota bacterium]
MLRTKNRMFGSGVFCLFLMLLASGTASANGNRSLTGQWATNGLVPYLHQIGEGAPDLFYTELVWTLSEDGNRLISGSSDFVAFDAEGTRISAGLLKLVGTGSGRSFALAQGDLSQSGTTGMTFQCTRKGSRRLVCLGTSTGSLSPLGLKLVLERINHR